MKKIPVFSTIGQAYGFTFGNLGTIVGLVWLPMAVLVALQYYVAVRYLNGYLSAFAQGNIYELNSATGLRYLSIILALLLQAILVTPVMRQALGLRTGRALVSFAVGPTALRVFGAMAALALIIIAIEYIAIFSLLIAFAFIAVVAKSVVAVHGVSSAIIAGCAVLGTVAIFIGAMIYVSVRLSFLVVAVAVAENKIDLIRAWRLTGRGFWRIFFVLLATALPIVILSAVLMWAALGFPVPHLPSPAAMAGWKGAPTKVLAWMIQAVVIRLPYIYGVVFAVAPFSVGLSTGAAAAAYRAVVSPLENNGSSGAPGPETSAA
jgi:hypothetical protein